MECGDISFNSTIPVKDQGDIEDAMSNNTTKFEEPLQLVPVEKWPELQSVFLSDWPRSLPGFNALETQSIWKKGGLNHKYEVYSLYGDLRNGFIAVNRKLDFYEIIIQYPRDDTDILERALNTTKVINWDNRITLPYTSYHVIEAMKKVIEPRNLDMDFIPTYTFIIEKGSPFFDDVRLPPGVTFGLLSSEHIDIVDMNWPHRYPSSPWYFQLLIDSRSGYGLFKDGKLACWIFIGECGHLTHLYTLEEYRKQGLAELMLKLITNKFLEENRQVFGFCVVGNEKSRNLFTKMKFAEINEVTWSFIDKKSN